MAKISGTKALGIVAFGLALASLPAHAQIPAAAPAILGLVNAGKTGLDGLQSFAVFREKITNDDLEKKIEPFFAAAIPSEAKGFEDLEGWKTRKLKCEFYYADPGLGALAVAWSQNELAKTILGGLSGGNIQPRQFWDAFAVSFIYTISFDYQGHVRGGRGQYLNNVLIQRDFMRVTQGWKFTASPGKYEATNAGTIAAPVPKIRTLLRFRVENAFGAASEMSQIFAIQGDGKAKLESSPSTMNYDKNIQHICRPITDKEAAENSGEEFKF